MRKRILSMLLACVMMITLFQVNVFAGGTGSRFVNYWGPYVSSDENCFVVFTDQDFLFHVYAYLHDNEQYKFYIGDKDVTNYATWDSNGDGDLTIPQNDLSTVFGAVGNKKIKIDIVSSDGNVQDSITKDIKYIQPYISVACSSFSSTYLVGDLRNEFDYSGYIINWDAYDGASPSGDYRGYLTIKSVDVVNDTATPNAFSVENKDSSFNIVANSVGTATLNLRYDVPEGYIDPNNGCYSIKIKAVEEYANVQVNKLDEDEYDYDIIPGDSVSLKAKINTYYAEDGADSVKEMERPVLSYEWSLASDYKGAATLTQDSLDPSKCTIKTTKALTDGVTVNVVVTYTDMYGKNQKEKTSYTLFLRDEKYKINCNVPEYVFMGSPVILKPTLSRSDKNGTTTIDNKDVTFSVSSSYEPVSIVDNGDGTFTLTRKAEGEFGISINAKYGDNEFYESYYVESSYNFIKFSENYRDYEGVYAGDMCLKIPKTLPDGLALELYYTIGNSNSSVKIDQSNYSIRYTDKGVAYINFKDEFLSRALYGNSHNFKLCVKSLINGKEVCSSEVDVYSNDSAIASWDVGCLLNESRLFSEMGYMYIWNNISDSRNYIYMIDSVKSNNTNIVSVKKGENGWSYTGCGIGTTYLTVNYHYYNNSQKVYQKRIIPVTIDKNKKTINVSMSKGNQYYLFPGVEYDYDINFELREANADGSYKYTKLTEDQDYDVKLTFGDGVTATSQKLSGNKFRVKIDPNSKEGSITVQVTAKDKDGKEIGNSMITSNVRTDAYYEADYDYLSENYDDDYNEINNVYIIKPYLYLYNSENPYGLDVSSKYTYNVELDEDTGLVYKGKNSDGSFTIERKLKKDERAWFKWIDKNSNELATENIWFEEPYEPEPGVPDDTYKPQITDKKMNLSLIDDNSIGLNMYFKTVNCNCDIVRVSYADQPNKVFYLPLKNDYSTGIHSVSVRVNSGEIAQEMKLEFLDYSRNVIDTVNTSVEKYAKALLASNDAAYAKYKPLVKAMLNYGAASQQYFGFKTNNLANSSLSASDKVVSDIPQSVITRNNLIKKLDNVNGLTYYGASLVLQDKCVTRLYFKLDPDRDISNYSFSLRTEKHENSETYTGIIPKTKDGLYYIELNNDTFFDNAYFHIYDERSFGGCDGFSYSPLNYIARAYSSNSLDAKTKNLFNALYWFEYQKQQL